MLLEAGLPSLFITEVHLMGITETGKFKHLALSQWLRVSTSDAVCFAKCKDVNSLYRYSKALWVKPAVLGEFIVEYARKLSEPAGIECTDCVLIHPHVIPKAVYALARKRLL